MRRLRKVRFRFFRGQTGFTLVEVLVALLLFAAIVVVFSAALSTASSNTGVIDDHTTARNIAATVIETIRSEPFSSDYTYATDSIALPAQYEIEIELKYSDDGGDTWTDNYSLTSLQRITITVTRKGVPVQSYCDYKMDI